MALFTTSIPDECDNRIGHFGGGGFSSDIGSDETSGFQDGTDGIHKQIGRGFFLELFKHHGDRPEGSDRIGDTFSGDIRSGTVDGFKHTGIFAFRVDVSGRRNTDTSQHGRTEVGQDISEEVAGDHNLKAFRVHDEISGKRIDVHLRRFHIRILGAHFIEDPVPENHGVIERVGFGRAEHLVHIVGFGVFKRVTDDAVGSFAGKNRVLNGSVIGSFALPAVFAFGIFPDNDEVDLIVFQR